MRLASRLIAAAALCLPAAVAQAVQVSQVEIVGLDEEMEANVRLALSIQDAVGRELTGRRLAHLVRVADDETREATMRLKYTDQLFAVDLQIFG